MKPIMWIDICGILVLILLAMEVATLILLRRLNTRFASLDRALAQAEARGREQAQRLESLDRLRAHQQLAEEAINTGATLAREVHQDFASIPFSILENIEPVAARNAHKLHDRISNDLFAAIGNLNRDFGRQLRGESDRSKTSGAPTPSKSDNKPKR